MHYEYDIIVATYITVSLLFLGYALFIVSLNTLPKKLVERPNAIGQVGQKFPVKREATQQRTQLLEVTRHIGILTKAATFSAFGSTPEGEMLWHQESGLRRTQLCLGREKKYACADANARRTHERC